MAGIKVMEEHGFDIQTLSSLLCSMRKERGVYHAEAAEMCHVSIKYWQDIEMCGRYMSSAMLRRFATAFGTDYRTLVNQAMIGA